MRTVHTVLLVEAGDYARGLLTRVLEDAGHLILAAPTVERAYEILEAHKEIRLLIVDMTMPADPATTRLAERAKMLRPSLMLLYTAGLAEALSGGAGTATEPREFAQRAAAMIKLVGELLSDP